MCFMNVLNKPLLNGYSSKEGTMCIHNVHNVKAQCEVTGLRMEKIHHHVLQFVDGTRNLWRQGQCWMQ